MTTDQCLAELAGKTREQKLAALEGMLRGQEVDPIWPQADVEKITAYRLEVLVGKR